MKNAKLPGTTGRFYLMSHIVDPKTWTRKRNFEIHQANLKLLAESIKGTCYEGAAPEQAVFYTKDTVKPIGTSIVSATEVVDENGVHYKVNDEKNGIIATDGDNRYTAGFDSWRQIRTAKTTTPKA
jgi:hypothetical protein